MPHNLIIISFCVGLNGKSPNFYSYVLNNPLLLKDPTGQIPLSVIGAVVSKGIGVLTAPPSQVVFGSKFRVKTVTILLVLSVCLFMHVCMSVGVQGAGAGGLIGEGAGQYWDYHFVQGDVHLILLQQWSEQPSSLARQP